MQGNILESDAQAIVNTVNCEGVMGKGLAYQFKQAYPSMERDYVNFCKDGKLKPGIIHQFNENGKLILNFPTKIKWREKSKITYITQGLHALKTIILRNNIQSLAIPPLGVGNGGLNWVDVKKEIENILKDIPANVNLIIYEPLDKTKSNRYIDNEMVLLSEILNHLDKPTKRRLKYAIELVSLISQENMIVVKPDITEKINKLQKVKEQERLDNRQLSQYIYNKNASKQVDKVLKTSMKSIMKATCIVNKYELSAIKNMRDTLRTYKHRGTVSDIESWNLLITERLVDTNPSDLLQEYTLVKY